jgi:hypothetical protein
METAGSRTDSIDLAIEPYDEYHKGNRRGNKGFDLFKNILHTKGIETGKYRSHGTFALDYTHEDFYDHGAVYGYTAEEIMV